MNLGLSGRRVLITGASAGIGAAIARTMAGEGANLVLAARTLDKLHEVREEIGRSATVDIDVVACDVSRSGEIDALAERYADIDILVNNAGAIPGGSLFDVDEARWRAGWDSKVFSYVHMCRRFYPAMKARGGGVIVNILGNGSLLMNFDYICGGMGNAALDFFTQTLGARSPADNIRVVGISPGPVDTERYRKIAEARVARTGTTREVPFGRIATPGEIADMVAFLASDKAAYVSGSIHVVDGGLSASRQQTGT